MYAAKIRCKLKYKLFVFQTTLDGRSLAKGTNPNRGSNRGEKGGGGGAGAEREKESEKRENVRRG